MLHRKLRIGDLIYNYEQRKIVCVDTQIISELQKDNNLEKFRRIPLNSKWLKKVFEFDSRYLSMQYMTVYTSRVNGIKIHEQRLGFFLSCTFRDKIKTELGEGLHISKPKIVYVDELMTYLTLLNNQEFAFEDNLSDLNNLFHEDY